MEQIYVLMGANGGRYSSLYRTSQGNVEVMGADIAVYIELLRVMWR
jgi:hypothetical protein